MSKYKQKPINIQEDEDGEAYILYPENAVASNTQKTSPKNAASNVEIREPEIKDDSNEIKRFRGHHRA